MLRQIIDDKNQEKDDLSSKLDAIQNEIKQIDLAVTAFQNELNKLTGVAIEKSYKVIKGLEIGEEAIKALERLGGSAHYTNVKDEIEKIHIISGINDKSKSDSVWAYLNKRDDVIKLGRGTFKLKTDTSAEDKKAVCRNFGLDPDKKTQWDMSVLHQAHDQLSDEELLELLEELSRLSGKDWGEYYRQVMRQSNRTPRV